MSDLVKHPKKLEKFLEASKRRIDNNDLNNEQNGAALRLSNFIRQGVKIGFALAGQDTKDFDNKTMHLISPRFLSVMPEDSDNSTVSIYMYSLKIITK